MRAEEPCVHEREDTFPLGRFFFLTGLPCIHCAAEAHEAWVEQVREQLLAGLEAARAGRRFEWEPSPQAVASAQIGAWELARVCHDD